MLNVEFSAFSTTFLDKSTFSLQIFNHLQICSPVLKYLNTVQWFHMLIFQLDPLKDLFALRNKLSLPVEPFQSILSSIVLALKYPQFLNNQKFASYFPSRLFLIMCYLSQN